VAPLGRADVVERAIRPEYPRRDLDDLVLFTSTRHPVDLAEVDWNEVGSRLGSLSRFGWDDELGKLYALLTADEPTAGDGR
jgi:hypothetical protein